MAKILIIDDEQNILNYFSKLLLRLGYEVETAADGRVGCERAANPAIKLIISDLHMQGDISQMNLIKKLREIRPDCPLVVVSGYPTPNCLEECERLGVRDFLTKPFEVSFIASVLGRLIPLKQSPSQAAPA